MAITPTSYQSSTLETTGGSTLQTAGGLDLVAVASIGDQADMVARMVRVLPNGWFPNNNPVLTGILTGGGNALAWIYGMVLFAQAQTRIATATGGFLDLAANDFFGIAITRKSGETDVAFSARIRLSLFQPQATRPALITMLTKLTGTAPIVQDPWRPGDVGAYSYGGLGYNLAGAYGSLAMPAETFVTVTPGSASYTDIYAAITAWIPAGATAWVRIIGSNLTTEAGVQIMLDGASTINLSGDGV